MGGDSEDTNIHTMDSNKTDEISSIDIINGERNQSTIRLQDELEGEPIHPSKSILTKKIEAYQSSNVDNNSITVNFSKEAGLYRFQKVGGKDSRDPDLAATKTFIYMAIPPDGGYGWVVLIIAIICHLIIDGIIFSIGIILPYMANDLSLTYSQTAFISSAQIGVYFLSAPLSSAFINRHGFRTVGSMGGIIAATAFLLGSYCDTLEWLFIYLGLIAGPSMGMLGAATTLITNYYFEKYRAMVAGLASSGSGVGVMTISTLNVHMVEHLGWRNTVRIHFALLFTAGLLALSYRDVKPTKIGEYLEYTDDDSDESFNTVEISSDHYSVYDRSQEKIAKSLSSLAVNPRVIETKLAPYSLEKKTPKKSRWSRYCCCCFRKKEPIHTPDAKKYILEHDPLDRSDIFYDGIPRYDRVRPTPSTLDVTEKYSRASKTSKSQQLLGSKARSINYTISVIRETPEHPKKKRCCFSPKIMSAFNNLFGLQLLKEPEFRLLLLEAFFYTLGFNIPFMHSRDRAEIEDQIANILPALIGFTNVVLRIAVGFLAYGIKTHPAYLGGIGMVLGGGLTFISAFYGHQILWFQLLYAVCFGLAAASFAALRILIYVRVLSLDKLTNAFGLTTMLMGIGVFVGTNIGGVLIENLESYTVAFAFSGGCIIASGIVRMCIPRYVKYRKKLEALKTQKKVRFTGIHKKRNWLCCDW